MHDVDQPSTSSGGSISRDHHWPTGSDAERGSRPDASRGGSRRFDTCRVLRRAALVAFGSVLAVPAVASAHGSTPGSGGGIVSAPLLIGGATATGVVLGLGAVLVGADRERFGVHDPVGGLLGLVLVVVGLAFVGTAVHHSWLLTTAGLSTGGLCVVALSRGSVCRSSPTVSTGSIPIVTAGMLGHRLLEGFALGGGVLSGSSFGLFAAAAITGHTAVESVGIGGYVASYDRLVAGATVVAVQAAFLLGASLATRTAVAGAAGLDTVLSGVVGGVLLVVGIREIATHLEARSPRTR